MKTVKILLAAAFLLFCYLTHAQSPDWLWAKSAGGRGTEWGKSITTDPSGNIIVAGTFDSSFTLGSTRLNSAGKLDIFIAKYDASGNVLWAKSFGGSKEDNVNEICADGSGNLYFTGYFSSPSITFGSTTHTNQGKKDIFITKCDGSGNVLWSKTAGGSENDSANSVSADANGNIAVTGAFDSKTLKFGSTILVNDTDYFYHNFGFLTKLDASGNYLWAKTSPVNFNEGDKVTIDQSGNIILAENSQEPFNSNIAISKLDRNGKLLWSRGVDSGLTIQYIKNTSITTDENGNVYVCGIFSAFKMYFGAIGIRKDDYTGHRSYLLKLDTSGKPQWLMYSEFMNFYWGYDVKYRYYDGLYFTGIFDDQSCIFFGTSDTIGLNGSRLYDSTYSTNIFVTKINSSGKPIWAKAAYGNYPVWSALALGQGGNAYLTGAFLLDTLKFSSNVLIPAGRTDIFLAKLHDNTVGIDLQNEYPYHLALFPNPVHNSLSLQYTLSEAAEVQLRIYNLQGQEVYSSAPERQSEGIHLKQVSLSAAAGMYFYRFTAGDKESTGKLIKE